MYSRKRFYLFLPFFIAFALFIGGISYADVDIPDAKKPVSKSAAVAPAAAAPAVVASGPSLSDVLRRIDALESRSAGGNVNAPKIRGLNLGFEIRHRFELRTDPNGFEDRGTASGKDPSTDSDFTLQRTRIWLDADVNKNVRGYVKLQDVRTWGAEQSTAGNLSRVDLLEGYVELRNLGDLSSLLENVSVKIGRWQQWYGNHRLIGHLNWANEARSYDGIKVRWDNKKSAWVDFFAYQIQEDQTGGVSGETGDGNTVGAVGSPGQKDELFWGVYSSVKVADGVAIEPYLIIRNRSRDADGSRTGGAAVGEQRYTAGARIHGKKMPWLPGVDFTFEQVWQFGKQESNPSGSTAYSSQDIQAFAGAWGVGYTFSNVAWTPRIGVDYVFASGDDNGAPDGRNNTFSQLYPTGHARLGYMDFHGWQNIEDWQIHFSAKPTKKLLLKADFHMFEAAEEGDAWYTVGGGGGRSAAPKFGGPATSFDDEYGDEIDITVKYQFLKNFGVVAGYSHYFIDDAIENFVDRETGGPGNDGDTDWFYVQTTMKF